MGLDNGVVIKNIEELSEEIKLELQDLDIIDDKDEVCYWRKCYNIREIFLNHLKESDDYYYSININNINPIIKQLCFLLIKDNWGNSIWTWEEQLENLITSIVRLKLLQHMMRKYTDIKVIFYDSY